MTAEQDPGAGLEPVTPDQEAALAELRAYQEREGITFENPDEPVGPSGGSTTEEIRGEPW
jgi:hypothetical protein